MKTIPDLPVIFWALGLPLLGMAAGAVLARGKGDRGWLLLSLVSAACLVRTLGRLLLFALLGAALGFALGYCGMFPVPN